MDDRSLKSRKRFKPLVWAFVLALVAADVWLCRKYWPMLAEPDDSSTVITKAIATRPAVQAIRLPGTILHPARGGWSVIGQMIEMVATPSGSNQFIYRYTFTKSDEANLADWHAMLKLQSEIAAAGRTRTLPPGMSSDQVAKIRPLLVPIAAPLDETTQQKLQSDLAALAAKASGKKFNDPTLTELKLALLDDLNAAGQTLGPALAKHLDEIKRYVGPSQWARLMPARRGSPTTRPAPLHAISLTTQPLGIIAPLRARGFNCEVAS
jgi:hypothetical protein